MSVDEIRGYDESVLTVDRCDVERAVESARKAWSWFERAIGMMRTCANGQASSSEGACDWVLGDERLMRGRQLCILAAKLVGCTVATAYKARKDLEITKKICSPRYPYFKLREDCEHCKHRNICRRLS